LDLGIEIYARLWVEISIELFEKQQRPVTERAWFTTLNRCLDLRIVGEFLL
jgi:hypothetical protein